MENFVKPIALELQWLENIISTSLSLYFHNESDVSNITELKAPELSSEGALYVDFIKTFNLTFEERLVLILAFAPHLKPQSLDLFLIENESLNTKFSEFGGYKNKLKSGFLPTLETACFIICGNDLAKRFSFMNLFTKEHLFYKQGILDFDNEQEFDLCQKLILSKEYLSVFITGNKYFPEYSVDFPAQKISTTLEWSDLIVENNVMSKLEEAQDWLKYSDTVLHDWDLSTQIKSGYSMLFFGASGTGKTLAATLLGKSTNKFVYRVNLSLFFCNDIRETEKKISKLFNEAERNDWILFFDEADLILDKSTEIKDFNHVYTNEKNVSFLLQRMEYFLGVVILATNVQSNIDKAFLRRFKIVIHFPKPDKEKRQVFWNKIFFSNFNMEDILNAKELAGNYELTGGEIVNVLRYCALQAAKREERLITQADILEGIRREYAMQDRIA